MAIKRDELTQYLNQTLDINNFKDYGPNGLQIEGKETISKIAFAVSATKASVQEAVRQKADALIVHHGLFWVFHGPRAITGPFAARVKPLIQQDINLYGYHLPLDAHPTMGNAASLADRIEMLEKRPFGDYKGSPTGVSGILTRPMKASELQNKLKEVLNHDVILSSPNPNQVINSLGIVTGGANGGWVQCLSENIDAYLTGEISEHDWHEAQEAGIHMFAGGHHATEQFGVQSLQKHLSEKYGIESIYIDSPNPA